MSSNSSDDESSSDDYDSSEDEEWKKLSEADRDLITAVQRDDTAGVHNARRIGADVERTTVRVMLRRP